MSKRFRAGSAFSLVVLASMIAGCATPQKETGFGGKADSKVGLATRALLALNNNDTATAISFAERAVEGTPDDAGFRALLGNAYFAAGRFWSAESAYKDALTIYSNQPQVVLKLALVEIALGKNDEAISFLEAGRSVLDAADYGLAMAMAGRASEAIPVLEAAARQQGADARVRQNLAMAYAYGGDWTNARTIAAQDVPANQLDGRIQQWMQIAKPAKPSDAVAALVGVTPALRDQGQPIRLALHKPDTRLAEAAPAPRPAPAPSVIATPVPAPQVAQAVTAPQRQFVLAPVAPIAVAEVQSAPAVAPAPPPPDLQRKPVAADADSSAPLPVAMMAAAAPEAPAAFVAFMTKKPAPAARPARVRRAAAPAPRPVMQRGNAVIQLGSYRLPQQVTAGWNRLTQRYPALRAYLPMRARFDSPNGTYWRLSIQGFANQREAIARCQLLKSHGGTCFVRGVAGDAPVQIASR